jgi:outer membrane protein TolC
MATVETTTIRVRRSTQERLAREAELAGKSLVDVLEAAADLLEEQRLLAGMDRAYRVQGAEIRKESGAWDATLRDGLPEGSHD